MTDGVFQARCKNVTFGREAGSLYGLHVDEVDGLTSVEVEEVGVAQYDGVGQYDFDNRIRDPRIITISGTVHARSSWELGQVEDQLRGLLADPASSAPLTWVEYGRVRWAQVRRYRGWAFRRVPGVDGLAEFTARFRAPSQLVYGESTEYGPASPIDVTNWGTFRSYPILRVTGTLPNGWTVTAGGVSYEVSQALTPGNTHSVDMLDGVLRRSGTPQPGATISPRILTVPGGSTRQFELDTKGGSGQMVILHRDTY
jgi:hypothetical protein